MFTLPCAVGGLRLVSTKVVRFLPKLKRLAVALPHEWAMGVMTEFDFAEDDDGSGYHPEFINTITFGHDIVGNLAGYVEFFSLVSADRNSSWVGTFDLGLTYALTDDIQLDGGVNLGVTRSADDVNPFVGISWRF
jgi:hypothetical protein